MKTDKVIETNRLFLKPTNTDDINFIFQLVNTPKWVKYIGDRNVYSLDDAKNYIKEKVMPQIKQLGYGNYTVILKSDGTKIGSCGLYDRAGLEGVDIGFAFLPEFEGQGYAFESSQKLLEVGFSQFNITTVNAITVPTNEASKKLLEKLGLVYKKKVRLPHDEHELILYQIIKKK